MLLAPLTGSHAGARQARVTNVCALQPRWALHYYQIDHRQTNYFAGLMELWLRWKLWQWSGRVTVPVLITPSGDDSRQADDHLSLKCRLLSQQRTERLLNVTPACA